MSMNVAKQINNFSENTKEKREKEELYKHVKLIFHKLINNKI